MLRRATIGLLLAVAACAANSDDTGAKPAALVHFKNTSSRPRWIVLDSQGTPVDFQVGVPPATLNGYGEHWCDGPEWNHNEPTARAQRIEPGEVSTTYWFPISVTRDGQCWRSTPLTGTHPTKACFYESEPQGIRLPGDEATNAALVCNDVTLAIPESASGSLVLDF
jgi:hypothetical protein